MATTGTHRRRYPKMMLGETVSVAIETFRVSKVRFILTSLGMVIGTASLILVVTIGLTGKQYLLAADPEYWFQHDGGRIRRRWDSARCHQ